MKEYRGLRRETLVVVIYQHEFQRLVLWSPAPETAWLGTYERPDNGSRMHLTDSSPTSVRSPLGSLNMRSLPLWPPIDIHLPTELQALIFLIDTSEQTIDTHNDCKNAIFIKVWGFRHPNSSYACKGLLRHKSLAITKFRSRSRDVFNPVSKATVVRPAWASLSWQFWPYWLEVYLN